MGKRDEARNRSNAEVSSSSRERFLRIYRALRERICLLEYAPGRQLGEEELAREFGISRTPIQRVLARLEAEGLLERRHGVGTIVTDVDLASLEQIYRLRLELATLMGRLAPMRVSVAEITRLEDYLQRMDKLVRRPDPGGFARLNMEFNLMLFSLIGNAPLREITERLFLQTTRIWIRSIPSMDDISEEVRIFDRQIFDVIAALRINDHGAVGDICRAHISMSLQRMRRQTAMPGHGVEVAQNLEAR